MNKKLMESKKVSLEDVLDVLGIDCIELNSAIPVKWKEGHTQIDYEITIKYISILGVGFDKVVAGHCTWVRFSYGTECTMPDGTKFVCESNNKKWLTDEDKQKFKQAILDWADNNKDFSTKSNGVQQ